MKTLTVVRHPLVDQALAGLRDVRTSTREFRQHAHTASRILLLEALRQVRVKIITVPTPLAKARGGKITQTVVAIPILRAGLAMLPALQEWLPAATVGFMGLERDEKTAVAHAYYQKIPPLGKTDLLLMLDPMLATGGSLEAALTAIAPSSSVNVVAVSIVAAAEGVARIQEKFPAVQLITAALDQKLNARKFIVPGLGDFGDRYFGI